MLNVTSLGMTTVELLGGQYFPEGLSCKAYMGQVVIGTEIDCWGGMILNHDIDLKYNQSSTGEMTESACIRNYP